MAIEANYVKSINRRIKKLADDTHPYIPVYVTGGENKLTLDDLLPRFPRGTDLILTSTHSPNENEQWCLEASPNVFFIEGDDIWPWPSSMAWYGPNTEIVLNLAEDDLRKVKR